MRRIHVCINNMSLIFLCYFYQLDMVIELNLATIKVLEGVQKKLQRMNSDEAAQVQTRQLPRRYSRGGLNCLQEIS